MIIQREKMIIQRVCERDCLSKTLGRKKLIPFEAKKNFSSIGALISTCGRRLKWAPALKEDMKIVLAKNRYR